MGRFALTDDHAKKIVKEELYLDKVYEINTLRDAWGRYEIDVIGTMGGDVLHFRIALNDDGTVKYVAEK